MRRVTIEISDAMARRALRDLGDEETGQYIQRGCRCLGCQMLRRVREAIAGARKEGERG